MQFALPGNQQQKRCAALFQGRLPGDAGVTFKSPEKPIQQSMLFRGSFSFVVLSLLLGV
jgi:hypothetical protein